MKIKNIVLSSLLASTIGCITASADITSLAEVSPTNFNHQVFGLTLMTHKSQNNLDNSVIDVEDTSYLNSVALIASNKATLKKFNYGSAELYWRGKMGYDLGLSNDSNGILGDLAFGLTKDFKSFFTTVELGYDYNDYKTDSGSSGNSQVKEDYLTHGVYTTLGFGFPLTDKIEAGIFGTAAQVNQQYELKTGTATTIQHDSTYIKGIISVPITYNIYKTISLNTKYSHELHSSSEITQDKITFGIAWQYNN